MTLQNVMDMEGNYVAGANIAGFEKVARCHDS